MTAVNQIPTPPLQVSLYDTRSNISKPWAIFFRELYNYLAFKGGNAIGGLEGQVDTNTQNIQTNADDISDLDTEFDAHVAAETAHGSNGNVVGFDDEATEMLFGLVQQMGLVADAVASTANASGSLGAAPATYDQAYTQDVTDLAESCRDAINEAVGDLNDAITQLNELMANSKTSGQMNTT